MRGGKRGNGVEFLERLSGLSQSDIQRIWAEVKENQSNLNGCPRPHDFQVDVTMTKQERRLKLRCTTCKGTLDASAASWYMKGLEDGQRHEVIS